MFPSKNTMENMNEMNRLMSKNNDFDIHSPMTSSSSHSFSHSIIPSSSSTETSPESYPETNKRIPDTFQQNYRSIEERPQYFEQRRQEIIQRSHNFDRRAEFPDRRLEYPRTDFPRPEFPNRKLEYIRPEFPNRKLEYIRPEFPDQRMEFHDCRPEDFIKHDFPETPIRKRPIIGRKFMATTETLPKIGEMDKFWIPNDFAQQTPPKSNSYELFPVENKGFNFRTPIKATTPTFASTPISSMSSMTISPIPMSPCSQTSVPMSPRSVPMSPRSVPMSPRSVPMSPRSAPMSPGSVPMSPNLVPNPKQPQMKPTTTSPFPQRFLFQEKPSTSQNSQAHKIQFKLCTFCRKNGETPLVYMAHSVKEKNGNRQIVSCPILRRHVCQTCGATGDDAHTITYCPVLCSTNNGQPLRSTTITLKNTRVMSNGRRRF